MSVIWFGKLIDMFNRFSESRLYSQEIQPIVSLHCLAIFLALKSDLCRYVSRWRCRDFVWIIDTPGRSWHQKRNIKTPPRLNRTTVRPTQRIQRWDTENGKKRRKAPKAPKQCKAQQILRQNHKISPFFASGNLILYILYNWRKKAPMLLKY